MTFELGRHFGAGCYCGNGLKEALVNSGFTRNQILTYTPDELASILEIEQYVAKLILG
jgi:hypothetical protein